MTKKNTTDKTATTAKSDSPAPQEVKQPVNIDAAREARKKRIADQQARKTPPHEKPELEGA